MSNKALIIIDIQQDYFAGGKFELFNSQAVLDNIIALTKSAREQNIPVILVQHVADETRAPAAFFNANTNGVAIHPELLAVAADAPVLVKSFSDSFEQTALKSLLDSLNVDELLVCGMMTQNCVTHTAISKAAEEYQVSIIADCCTSSDAMIHNIALDGVSHRVPLIQMQQAL